MMLAYSTLRGSVELGTAMFLCYPLILMGIARLRLRCIETGRGGSCGPLMGPWFQSYGAERCRIFHLIVNKTTPVTAADLLNDRVLPFFEEHKISLPGLRFDIIGVFLHGKGCRDWFTEVSGSKEAFPDIDSESSNKHHGDQ